MVQVISRDGTAIACHRSGAGPDLVLVHGTIATHARWAPVLPRLEQAFTVTRVERRGRGDSGDAPDHSLARECEDVAAVVETLPAPVLLFGHSYGALCALGAARLTDRLAGLILYEPPPSLPDETPIKLLEAMLETEGHDAVISAFMTRMVGIPETELAMLRAAPEWRDRVALAPTLPRELRALGAVPDAANLRAVTIPTLFLLGGESPPHFAAATETLANALPDARIQILPGQRHVAIDTAPDMIVDAILDFRRAIG